jgi:hypothetical protein
MTTKHRSISSDTLLMIQSFRQANPDKRDRQLSAAEFLRKKCLAHSWDRPIVGNGWLG